MDFILVYVWEEIFLEKIMNDLWKLINWLELVYKWLRIVLRLYMFI